MAEIIRVVTARDGDSFCNIAVANGFKNCRKVREANPGIANRDLQPGDRVNVPNVDQKEEPGPVDQVHRFKRLGSPTGRIFFIQDRNTPTPDGAMSHRQRALAVSNYVTGRQGSGFATQLWRDHNFFGFDAGASDDPDHFKIQVFDRHAAERGDTQLTVRLQTQRPRLNGDGLIERWEDMADPGTQVDVICKQVQANSPWYRSHYLRLVAERDDQNNRPADNVDNAADRTPQTLVVPLPTDDQRIEILDLRSQAHKDAEDCGATGAQQRCRALGRADVGKSEVAMRFLVLRVHDSAPPPAGQPSQAGLTTPAQIRQTLLQNVRLQLAQCNIGLKLIDIKDVPPPRNMIAVGDNQVVKASGGEDVGARVAVTASGGGVSIVSATINTDRKDTPEETARKLAAELQRRGVRCRVSTNPPERTSGDDFGPCDVLCFNADNTPARVIAVTNQASEQQKLSHTGSWDNNRVTTPSVQYGAREPGFRLIGSADFRALLKNNFTGTSVFHTYVVNEFTQPGPGTLLGLALIPYHEVNANVRPRPEFTMGVLVTNNAAQRRTVVTHEAGHVMLDAIHTTKSTSPDQDWQGNTTNARLAFSEMMTAFDSSVSGGAPQPFLHKRLSDAPLTVEFQVAHRDMEAKNEVFGQAPLASVTQRFRSLFPSVYENLRRLEPAPGSNL